MDPFDAVLSATVTLAQDLLSEKPSLSRLMPNLLASSPNKPLRLLGRRRNDDQQLSSDDDEDTDLDLLVFARLQKRRRDRLMVQMPKANNSTINGGDSDDSSSSSMSDSGVLYPTVSLHEPEVVVNNGHHHRGAAAMAAKFQEPTGSDCSPFMMYLKGCPDLTFETQFKLSRETFSKLLKLIGPSLARNPSVVDPTHALLITLWLLISSEDTLSVSERFDVTRTCCQLTYASVCQAIAVHRSHFVQWNANSKPHHHQQGGQGGIGAFERISNITCPNVIGVIGCTRFRQLRPETITSVQAICDAYGKFMHIHCTSSLHEMSNAEILAASPVHAELGTGRMFMVSPDSCPTTTCHLTGDQSYPLGSHLIVPFKSPTLTHTQRTFNASLTNSNAIIDKAFARLRERFVKLRGGTDVEPVRAELVVGNLGRFVETALSLHNFCMLVSDSYYLDGTQRYERENGQMVCFEDRAVPPDVLAKRNLLAELVEQRVSK